MHMNRRIFLGSALSAGAMLASPNDTVRVACVGVRGRGRDHIRAYSGMPNVEIAAMCDIDESILNAAARRDREGGQEAARGIHRPAQAARGQVHRRDLDRHAEPPPHAADHLGLPGRQGRVRREAVLARHVRGAADCGGGEEVRPHGAARNATAGRRIGREAVQKMRDGADRRRLHGARPLLQVARHDRPQAGRAGAAGRALRSLAGTGAAARVHREPLPLQLALVLGLRQRRHRQPGHSSDGCGALGPRREVSDQGQRHGRHFHVRRRPGDAEHDDARFRIRRGRRRRRCWNSKCATGSPTTKPASTKPKPGNTVGTVFYGSKGYLSVWDEDHGRYQSYLGKEQEPGPSGAGLGNNWANFIQAVRSRKHVGLERAHRGGRHLRRRSCIWRTSRTAWGRSLHFDAASYSCKGDAEANRLFRRAYRKGFEVPEKV